MTKVKKNQATSKEQTYNIRFYYHSAIFIVISYRTVCLPLLIELSAPTLEYTFLHFHLVFHADLT